MDFVKVGSRRIGTGYPSFLVAEIGINHNGDLEMAKESIDAAAEAGADSVKFQNYRTEDFISDKSLTYQYESQGRRVVESQYEMFKRYELTFDNLCALKEHCDRRGIIFHSTPTSKQGIDQLLKIGAPLLKNGSDYLTNLKLIRAMAQTGLPTVISTGMATLAEIDDAVRAFRKAGNDQLILLHCVSSYPTSPDDVHLRKIPALALAFGCPVGFSDHTSGTVAAIGAVAMGACWIEKHFTLDKKLPGPDHHFSADPAEFRNLVEAVRTLERNLGLPAIGPTPTEETSRRDDRLSCVALKDLATGHCLTESDVVFQRPGTGLPPRSIDWIIGRHLGRNVKAGKVLEPDDFA